MKLNKKGNVISIFMSWIVIVGAYFLIGLPLINGILEEAILPQLSSDIIIFLVKLAPFVPFIGFMIYGYVQMSGSTGGEAQE